jgi:lipopolysaccharide biosynthesis regulator YciM
MNNLTDSQYAIFICKVEYTNGKYLALDKVHRITKEDKESLIEVFEKIYQDKNEQYKSVEMNRILAQYWVKNNSGDTPVYLLSTLKEIKKTNNPKKVLDNSYKTFSIGNIPLNRDYLN